MASRAVKSSRLLRSHSTGSLFTSTLRLVPTPVLQGHRSAYSFHRALSEFCASNNLSRHYSTVKAALSTDDVVYQPVKTDLHGNADLGQVRCDEMAFGKDNQRIARVTIQNNTKGNSLNPSLLRNLTMVFRDLASRDNLRCVILTGNKQFSTGMHVNEISHLESPEQAKNLILQVYEAGQAIREIPVPTIAQIEGRCFGAGLELAACCDFRYALSGCSFAMPEVELGIPSVVQARLVANIIGWQKTRRFLLMGNTIDADVAMRWGLVDQVNTTPEYLRFSVNKLVQILGNNGPIAMKAQKRLIQYWEEHDLVSGVRASVDVFAAAFENGAGEPKEYTKKFFQNKEIAKQAYESKIATNSMNGQQHQEGSLPFATPTPQRYPQQQERETVREN